ncbi:flagellar hook-length control protein FliK [Roseixanthobacter pseudopolyaromaticivorans]|uniref:flagellar hook-length control protein FliK n=1 Tax=Xanthobacteraceae TaxID=335928 RepID=UPI0037278FF9
MDGGADQGFAAVFKQIAAPAQDLNATAAAAAGCDAPQACAVAQAEDMLMSAPDETTSADMPPAGERPARPGRTAVTSGPGSLSQLLLALGRPARASAEASPLDQDVADDRPDSPLQAVPDLPTIPHLAAYPLSIMPPDLPPASLLPPQPKEGTEPAAPQTSSTASGDPAMPDETHVPTRAEEDAAGVAFVTMLGSVDTTASMMPLAQNGESTEPPTAQTPDILSADSGAGEQARPIQVSVISRETHFAPIRNLNGQTLPFAQTLAAVLPAGPLSGVTPALAANNGHTPPSSVRTSVEERPLAMSRPQVSQPPAQVAAAGQSSGPTASDVDRAPRLHPTTDQTHEGGALRTADAARAHGEAAPTDHVHDAHAVQKKEQEAEAKNTSSPEPSAGPQSTAMGSPVAPAGSRTLAEMPTVRQVAEAISNEMASLGAPDTVGAATSSLAGPVRVLEIQLHPDDLGMVNVRLRLTPQGLEVRLRAGNPDTARMLEQDRDALGEILRSAGYQADDIQIITTDTAGFTGMTGHDSTSFLAEPPASGEERGSERQPGGGSGRQHSDSSNQKGTRGDEKGDRDSFGRGDFSR